MLPFTSLTFFLVAPGPWAQQSAGARAAVNGYRFGPEPGTFVPLQFGRVGGGSSYWGGLSSIGMAPTIAGPGDCGHSLQRGAPLCLEEKFRRSVTQAAARFSCRPLNTSPGPLSPPTLLLFHLFTNLSESKSIATNLLFSTAHNLKHRPSLLDHPLCQSPWAANSGPSKRRRSFGWS